MRRGASSSTRRTALGVRPARGGSTTTTSGDGSPPSSSGRTALATSPDVVVVDPPRAGLTPKAVRRVLELAPRRLVYVSCNPTTLAGTAALLDEGGYRLERVRPVDMFPHTHHVECVARFERTPAADQVATDAQTR